jgi:hypothetical protein
MSSRSTSGDLLTGGQNHHNRSRACRRDEEGRFGRDVGVRNPLHLIVMREAAVVFMP